VAERGTQVKGKSGALAAAKPMKSLICFLLIFRESYFHHGTLLDLPPRILTLEHGHSRLDWRESCLESSVLADVEIS
jgi:hypothetical protein